MRKRMTKGSDQRHVRVATHYALVAVLIQLDTIAAAVLGGLAGDLGCGERVRERLLAVADPRHAEACGHLDRLASGYEVERTQLLAQHLRELPPAIQRRLAHQHGEAVTGDA